MIFLISVQDIQDGLLACKKQFGTITKTIQKYELRFTKILPILWSVQSTQPNAQQPNFVSDVNAFSQQVHQLAA
jgi:hypothetical protein